MRFSIITPSFRQLDWLSLCAASVADQAIEVEHLVQDAGTEGIGKWMEAHPTVAVCVEKDAGMYDAINRGMARAMGEILAYLNCDEQYLPGTLRKVEAYFASHPDVDILFGDALLVNANGEPLSYRRVVRPGRLHTRLCHLGVWSCAMFFRSKLRNQGHSFPLKYRAIGDAVFVEQVLAAGAKVAVLSQPLSVFTLLGDNLGCTTAALQEAREWKESWGASGKFLAPWLRGQHWLEKALAGAYLAQAVDYSIYTMASPARRSAFHAEKLGWRWPKQVGV